MHARGLMAGLALALAVFSVGCKPAAESTLADIATASSLKTGFFLPMIEDEYAYGGQARIKTPEEFARLFGMKLEAGKDVRYFVATSAEGESILVVKRKGIIAGPAASIDAKGRKFVWDYVAKPLDKSLKRLRVTNLFIKYPLGQSPRRWVSADGNESNLFFVRASKTQDGFTDPVLINWVDHLVTEAGVLLYRVGNVVFTAEGDLPVLKFRAVGHQVWELEGSYEDQDVAPGTLFWTPNRRTYFSLNPKNGRLVRWERQDKDSMDRVGPVSKDSVRIPSLVLESFEAKRRTGLALKGEGTPFFGSDWLKMDRRTIPLVQTPARHRVSDKKTAFGLTEEVAPEGQGFDAFFEPRLEGFHLAGPAQPKGHKGPIPGLPVYDPKTAYPANTVVQVEYPPKSGTYYEGRLPHPQTVTRNVGTVGWVFKDRIDTKHTTLEIAGVDESGKKVYSGYKLKFDNDMVVDEKKSFLDKTQHDQVYEIREAKNFQWTTASADLEAQRAKTERYLAEADERAAELRDMTEEHRRLQNRVEEKANSFESHASIKGATKFAANTVIGLGANKLASGSAAQSTLDRLVTETTIGAIEGGAISATHTVIDATAAKINGGEFEFDSEALAGNLTGKALSRGLKGVGFESQEAKFFEKVTSDAAERAVAGGDDRTTKEIVADGIEAGASAVNGMAWSSMGAVGWAGEYFTEGVIKGAGTLNAASVEQAYAQQIDQKGMELTNLRNAGDRNLLRIAEESQQAVGRSWDQYTSQPSYESASQSPGAGSYEPTAGYGGDVSQPSSGYETSYDPYLGGTHPPAIETAMDL